MTLAAAAAPAKPVVSSTKTCLNRPSASRILSEIRTGAHISCTLSLWRRFLGADQSVRRHNDR